MGEMVTAEAILQEMSDIGQEMRGYEKSKGALGYSLASAVAERLEQLEGTPPGYGRLNHKQRITRMREWLDALVAAAKQVDTAEMPVKGPAE